MTNGGVPPTLWIPIALSALFLFGSVVFRLIPKPPRR
jgi:hypothetical protein